ncbi:hypothetical protein [Mesorhizobium sp. SP-1A]|uniref:hypothetical protein n=1 Tax=Mesorhizobium sp. SP-1A TaxID=3077840 RepID=UPI0028F6E568|nr:hypothetical protein [Mesorhizobium sp. SP-1A]
MRKIILAVFVSVAALSGSAALAEITGAKNSVRASCTVNGRIVYREDLPVTASFEQRKKIMDAFPYAMCIFLANSGPQNTQSTVSDYGFDRDAGSDDGLVAALAAISGGQTGERYPDDIARMFPGEKDAMDILGNGTTESEPHGTNPAKQSDGFVNLTLGIYKNMKMGDILAHWKVMQKHGPTLRKMTPTFDTVDDITVMSIMQVPDALADKVCTEASEKGQGCIAFF